MGSFVAGGMVMKKKVQTRKMALSTVTIRNLSAVSGGTGGIKCTGDASTCVTSGEASGCDSCLCSCVCHPGGEKL
jgi:hypothetical protein